LEQIWRNSAFPSKFQALTAFFSNTQKWIHFIHFHSSFHVFPSTSSSKVKSNLILTSFMLPPPLLDIGAIAANPFTSFDDVIGIHVCAVTVPELPAPGDSVEAVFVVVVDGVCWGGVVVMVISP
jgi:hypothetical protein